MTARYRSGARRRQPLFEPQGGGCVRRGAPRPSARALGQDDVCGGADRWGDQRPAHLRVRQPRPVAPCRGAL